MSLTQITTGGVDENINIDSNTLKVDGTNNRVGIGTAAPTRDLEVSKAGSAFIRAINTTNSVNIDVLAGTSAAFVGPQSNHPLAFQTNNTERLRIDSAGRLLVGTTTEGVSGGDNFTIGATNHAGMTIRSGTSNRGAIYFSDGTSGNAEYRGYIEYDQSADYMRFGTGAAERIRIDSSGMVDFQTGIFGDNPSDNFTLNGRTQPHYGFNLVPETGVPVGFSGYRGIAFATNGSERMRIDSLGNVGVGLTSPASKLHVKGGSLTVEHATPSTGTCQLNINSENNSQVTLTYDDQGSIVFGTASTPATQAGFSEKIRIDSSGNVGIGTDSPGQLLTIKKTGYQTQVSLISDTNESGAIYFGDTASTNRGVVLYDHGQDSLQLYTAASERMRIDSSGDVLIGTTSAFSGSSSTATGHRFESIGVVSHFRNSGTALYVGRQGNDGDLVSFRQAGSQEGSISVSGSTVSFNGGHLSRWSQLPGGAERTEILRGSVLSNLNEMCEWGEEDNEQLNRMKVSDVEGDKNVSGVFQAWDDDDDTYVNDFYCAMTGDFVIRIAQGTTVARGDLLMSAGDGTAKPQDDDIVRSKTIAKVTSTTVSTTYSDNSYCVPCVLMAC